MQIEKNRLLRWWTYFRRGHSTYLAFFLSFANFIVIQYRLLVEYIPALKILFSNLTAFLITFVVVYVPVTVIIGWLDFRRLAAPMDMALMSKANPWVKDLAEALILIAKGDNEKAVKILEKWTKGF